MAADLVAGKTVIATTINGEPLEIVCEPRESLLEVLRDTLHLTGAKEGCNNGNCGACNVILDGRLVNSCCVMAVEVVDGDITTIEGLATAEGLHRYRKRSWRGRRYSAGYARRASSCRRRRCWTRIRIRLRSRFDTGWRVTCAVAPGTTRSCGRCRRRRKHLTEVIRWR